MKNKSVFDAMRRCKEQCDILKNNVTALTDRISLTSQVMASIAAKMN